MNTMVEIDEQWNRLARDSDPQVRHIVEIAASYPSLRRLWPFASHSNLRFSRHTTYPYDLDLPYVLTSPDGSYEARGGDHSQLGRGELREVVAMVASAMEEILIP